MLIRVFLTVATSDQSYFPQLFERDPHGRSSLSMLLSAQGQRVHGGRAGVCSFKDAGSRVAATLLVARHGVDGALPRRHAPRFPSGARLPRQKSVHHVPLTDGSAAVLSRCPGVLNGNPCYFDSAPCYYCSALLQTLQFTRLQKLTCARFHNQHPPTCHLMATTVARARTETNRAYEHPIHRGVCLLRHMFTDGAPPPR